MYFIVWYGMQGLDNIKTRLINLMTYYIILENCQFESEQESRVKCNIGWNLVFYININCLYLCHHWICIIDWCFSDLADYHYYNFLAYYVVDLTLLQYKINYRCRTVFLYQNLILPVRILAWIIRSWNIP